MGSQASRYFTEPNQLRMAQAIESGNTREIAQLIASGTVRPNDYRAANEKIPQYNFLAFAVLLDRKESIQALLASGADPNSRSPEGISGMSIAASSADAALLPMLVAAGGDVNLRGRTHEPLTFDAFNSDRFDNLRYLMNHGVDLNALDTKNDSLLSICAAVRSYDWLLEVLRRGADPRIPQQGNTYIVGWYVQKQAGRLTPAGEAKRQEVIAALMAKGISFPVPEPSHWDSKLRKYTYDKH